MGESEPRSWPDSTKLGRVSAAGELVLSRIQDPGCARSNTVFRFRGAGLKIVFALKMERWFGPAVFIWVVETDSVGSWQCTRAVLFALPQARL
jgi:hypothetical protein